MINHVKLRQGFGMKEIHRALLWPIPSDSHTQVCPELPPSEFIAGYACFCFDFPLVTDRLIPHLMFRSRTWRSRILRNSLGIPIQSPAPIRTRRVRCREEMAHEPQAHRSLTRISGDRTRSDRTLPNAPQRGENTSPTSPISMPRRPTGYGSATSAAAGRSRPGSSGK